jgi:hypothetical protein
MGEVGCSHSWGTLAVTIRCFCFGRRLDYYGGFNDGKHETTNALALRRSSCPRLRGFRQGRWPGGGLL